MILMLMKILKNNTGNNMHKLLEDKIPALENIGDHSYHCSCDEDNTYTPANKTIKEKRLKEQ